MDGNLIYDGEFLDGKRNGKGKEYYKEGKLKFEGNYLNGEKNGKGKEYYHNGQLAFNGEYINGEKMEKPETEIENIFIKKIPIIKKYKFKFKGFVKK